MFAVRSVLRNPTIVNGTKKMYHKAANFKPASMDELPVPYGSWQAHYKAKQSKYNLHLLVGLLFTGVTLVAAKASGLVYLNYSPPSLD